MNTGLWRNAALRLISDKPSNQRHAAAALAGLRIVQKPKLCKHDGWKGMFGTTLKHAGCAVAAAGRKAPAFAD